MTLNPNDDVNGLLGAMAQLQAQLSRAESDANARAVTGIAANGLVRVEASGEFSFDKISIDPTAIDADDPSLLEDLVLVAIRDAVAQLKAIRKQAMGGAVSEALGGLFGASESESRQ